MTPSFPTSAHYLEGFSANSVISSPNFVRVNPMSATSVENK